MSGRALCPTCHQPISADALRESRIDAKEQRLRERAKELGIWISGDGTRVTEIDAALLVEGHLGITKRWRGEHPESAAYCKQGGRWYWYVRELAEIAEFGWTTPERKTY